MLKIKVLMSPRISWMQIFEDFKEILRDAVSQIIGDLAPRNKIEVESDYDGDLSPKVIVKMYWKKPWEPSPVLRKSIADHTLSRASEFIAANVSHAITDVEIYANCKE